VNEVVCFGCGALVPDQRGPVHEYMLSAPGCWAMYGSILAWHAGRPRRAAAGPVPPPHLADAYAAQHPANPDRRNRQSVAVHLMSLCAGQERGISGDRLRQMIGRWTHRDYPQLRPGPDAFPVTIRDVADAAENARLALVAEWAASTWTAWSAHHDTIRTWLTAQIGPAGGCC
jgi:hypothetical protein